MPVELSLHFWVTSFISFHFRPVSFVLGRAIFWFILDWSDCSTPYLRKKKKSQSIRAGRTHPNPQLTNVIINYMQLVLSFWHTFRSKKSCWFFGTLRILYFTYRGGFAPHNIIGTTQNTLYCLEYELGSLMSCGAICFWGLGWQGLCNSHLRLCNFLNIFKSYEAGLVFALALFFFLFVSF